MSRRLLNMSAAIALVLLLLTAASWFWIRQEGVTKKVQIDEAGEYQVEWSPQGATLNHIVRGTTNGKQWVSQGRTATISYPIALGVLCVAPILWCAVAMLRKLKPSTKPAQPARAEAPNTWHAS